MAEVTIAAVSAREILDSRGNPTVAVEITPRRRGGARARQFHPEHRRVHAKRSNFATATRIDFAARAC